MPGLCQVNNTCLEPTYYIYPCFDAQAVTTNSNGLFALLYHMTSIVEGYRGLHIICLMCALAGWLWAELAEYTLHLNNCVEFQ